jgi:glucose-6-phosphate isomerase
MRGRTFAETRTQLAAAGKTAPEDLDLLAAAKTFAGNTPSTSIVFPLLTPRVLGMIVALYEHKIFVQGVVWDVNSFDQMGVELGKELAGALLEDAPGATSASESQPVGADHSQPTGTGHDSSTLGLLSYLRAHGD